jgi:hypothetical protein
LRKKQATLHKRNEFIRGSDKYSVIAKRALNSIYFGIQKQVNSGNKNLMEKSEYLNFEAPYFRKMLGLEKVESYMIEIEKALKELQEPLELNNFKNPKDGKIYNWYSISCISEATWFYDEKERKKKVTISLSPLTKWLMINTNDGNFTKLELIPTLNKLRTKYSMKLYEFFKSFETYRYINLQQEHILKLLGINPTTTTYKYYSKFYELLQRQIKEINNKTDLELLRLVEPTKELKQDKIFKFIINPKNKAILKDKKRLEDVITKMINRF